MEDQTTIQTGNRESEFLKQPAGLYMTKSKIDLGTP